MPQSRSLRLLTGNRALLARRYAAALYELAQSSGQMETVQAEIEGLQDLCRSCDPWRAILADPLLSVRDLTKLCDLVVKTAGFGALVGRFLAVLAKNKRLVLLEDMCTAFFDRVALERHETKVEVVAARSLTDEVKAQLSKALEKATGGPVGLYVAEDSALLGGLQVKIGSRQIDASLRGKLTRLGQKLKTQTEAA